MATVDYVLLLFWMIIILFCCFQCIVPHRRSELYPRVVGDEDDDSELEEAVAVPLTPRSASQCVTKIVLDVDSA